MALGDGIRRNIATITQAERDRFRDTVLALDSKKFYPDGVSFWDKQDQIHAATHVHGGPAFLPWHRELCNRFEALLRQVDPQLSLHYWNWTSDPRNSPNGSGGATNLFSTGKTGFMGSAAGTAGSPLDGFSITRNVRAGVPAVASDAAVVTAGDGSSTTMQYPAMRQALEDAHNQAHVYIGGTLGDAHISFRDPFVFLLHSNVDRLWAQWQLRPGQTWRLDPNRVYGVEGTSVAITERVEPWAGASGLRPWAPPENQQLVKTCKHPSIVAPPRYDYLPAGVPSHSCMAVLNNRLYSIQGGALIRTNPADRSREVLGIGDEWFGSSCMTASGNYLYIVQGRHLVRADGTNGSWQVMGTGDWTGSTCMAAYNGQLYIVQGRYLVRANPSDGGWTVVGTDDWTGSTCMAVWRDQLYVVQGGALVKVNPSNGQWQVLGAGDEWAGSTCMTAWGDYLYIVQGGALVRATPGDGSWKVLGSGTEWAGSTSMASYGAHLYITQDAYMVRCYPADGRWEIL